MSNDSTQISPIPPEGYGDRFVKFIRGITMSKEEAERHRESKVLGRPSTERTPSVERTMEAAEKEASKDVSATHPRVLSTVWDPADATAPGPTSTLPIVDEAGEASSVGGHSQRGPNANSDKTLPQIPNQGEQQMSEKGKSAVRNGSQHLQPIPA